MQLPSWIDQSVLNRLTLRGPAQPVSRLQISNLTRQTVLATNVEVAANGATRRKGLLGRQGLAEGEGLWIFPCEAVHTFGMRFSLDLVYLDRRKHVKKLKLNVPPWRLSACFSAYSTIELAAGTVRDTLTEIGDILEFSPASQTVDRVSVGQSDT